MHLLNRAILIIAVLAVGLLTIPGRAFASTPVATTVTTVTDQGFSVAWDSRFIEAGSVNVGTNCASLAASGVGEQGNGYSHLVAVTGLNPSTAYYYQVVSGGATYPGSTTCYGPVTTGPTLGSPPPTPVAIYGTVLYQTVGTCLSSPVAPGTVVRLYVKRGSTTSATISTVSNSNGDYTFNIGDIRTSNNAAYFNPVSGDVLDIYWEDGNLDPRELRFTYGGAASQLVGASSGGNTCITSVQNYMGNPSFDNSTPNPWILTSAQTLETTTVHSGTRALQDNATSTSTSALQAVAVAPNTTYQITGWVNQSADTSATQGGAYLAVQDYDTGSALPGGNIFAPATLNTWVQVTGTVTTGPTTRILYVRLQHQVPGTYFWDDVLLLSTQLVNGGYEMSPNGTMNWLLFTPSGSTTTAQTGTVNSGHFSLKIVATGAGYFAYQQIAVTPGSTHTITAYVNQSVANGAYLAVWAFPGGATLKTAAPTTVGSYQQISATFTVPAGVNEIEVVLKANTAGTYYWDDFAMT